MPSPKPGEIWLVRFPFTDLTTTKLRPAFVVATHGEDIVTGIFSRLPSNFRATWVLIDEQQAGFNESGLKRSSVLKAEKIAVIHESVFQRKLGTLAPNLMAGVLEALKKALLIP